MALNGRLRRAELTCRQLREQCVYIRLRINGATMMKYRGTFASRALFSAWICAMKFSSGGRFHENESSGKEYKYGRMAEDKTGKGREKAA